MNDETPIIGVLDLQGAVREHVAVLERLGIPAIRVRLPDELDTAAALIIPGGESTTVGKLMERRGLDMAIRERAAAGMPVFGTCMGMITMAREIDGSEQHRLGLMDIGVLRNAFGRQLDSFEADLEVPSLGPEPVHAVFIRAPVVTRVGSGVEVLARWEGNPVAVRQGRLLATSFHPELTRDTRFHELLVKMARVKA